MTERLSKWIKQKLGITRLEHEVERLEQLDHYTLADVVDRISMSYIILAGNEQKCVNNIIEIPDDKNGILVLGNRAIIKGCYIKGIGKGTAIKG